VIDLSDHADIGAFAYADRAGILRYASTTPRRDRNSIALPSRTSLTPTTRLPSRINPVAGEDSHSGITKLEQAFSKPARKRIAVD